MKIDKNFLGVTASIVSTVLYGVSFLFTKKITGSVSPMTLIAWRFMTSFLVFNLLVWLRLIKIDLRGKPLFSLLGLAIFHPVFYFIGETFGINLTTASESSVIIACIPIAVLLLSTILLKEAPTKLQVIGISISAAGIITVVVVKGLEATFNPVGYAMLLLAVFSFGLFSVFSQKATAFTVVEKTYAMNALGAVVFPTIALVENAKSGTVVAALALPFTSLDFLTAILYLGVGCSIGAFLLSNISLATIGTNRTASFAGIATIVSVISGVVLLGESFSIYQIIGTTLVLGGVYLANSKAGMSSKEKYQIESL